jgi:hypothetical protein
MPKNSTEILRLADDWAASLLTRDATAPPPHGITLPPRPDKTKLAARLVGQAEDLDALFRGLTRWALLCSEPQQAETLMRMALRCQSQAVKTTAALADMGAPKPIIFEQRMEATGD